MAEERLTFHEEAILHHAERGGMAKHSMLPDPVENMIDPFWVPNPVPDPDRHQLVVPDFKGYPCPPAAQFLFLARHSAPSAPPWRVRVSPRICAIYSMAVIAKALAPYATIITTPDGRSPAPQLVPANDQAIEWDYRDQNLPADRDYDPSGILWTPPQRTR